MEVPTLDICQFETAINLQIGNSYMAYFHYFVL